MKLITDTKKVYDKGYAKSTELLNDYRLNKVLKIIQHLDIKSNSKILDAGCGDGYFTLKIGKLIGTINLYGFDISKQAVIIANNNSINAVCLDIDKTNLPFKNNLFDFIFCGSLIELVVNADHLIIELRRVLKKNGFIIITFPNLCSWGSRLTVPLGYIPYYYRLSTKYDFGKFASKLTKGDSTGFIRLFSLSSFKQFIKLYNLNIVKICGAPATGLPILFQPVDKLFSNFPSLAFQNIIVLNNKL